MPIYEYQCKSCGRRSEEFQKMSDPPLTECEECGGELKKLISAPAVQFKGSGWYVTDYAKSGASQPKAEGTSASGGDSGDSKSSSSEGKSSSESSKDSGGSSSKDAAGSKSSDSSGSSSSSGSSGSSGSSTSSSPSSASSSSSD